jgi:RNA polymerase sigma-70 factor (ECF subfamily)
LAKIDDAAATFVTLTTLTDDDPPSEAVLVRRAQEGQREAFAALVDKYWDRIYRWLYRLTHHQQTAEDLAQETFLKALAHLESFNRGGNFQAWLYRIAYNSFLNQRRSSGRMSLEIFPENLAGGGAGPEDEALGKEVLQQVARAVGRLPGDFRSAFLLRVEEGLSFREIAEVIGTTEQTARWRVFKARQKLIQVLAPIRESGIRSQESGVRDQETV